MHSANVQTVCMPNRMRVEVAYATPERQRVVSLEVPDGTTVYEAAALSGLTGEFPEIDLTRLRWASLVSGVKTATTTVLHPGDRVELYRPLIADPKANRRLGLSFRRPLAPPKLNKGENQAAIISRGSKYLPLKLIGRCATAFAFNRRDALISEFNDQDRYWLAPAIVVDALQVRSTDSGSKVRSSPVSREGTGLITGHANPEALHAFRDEFIALFDCFFCATRKAAPSEDRVSTKTEIAINRIYVSSHVQAVPRIIEANV